MMKMGWDYFRGSGRQFLDPDQLRWDLGTVGGAYAIADFLRQLMSAR